MDSESQLIFVYGTLRGGGCNHFRMAGAVRVGAGILRGRIYRIAWYPGLVLDPAGDEVQGELYWVKMDHLAALDAFEGLAEGRTEGLEYRRVTASVIAEDANKFSAWVWEWRGATSEKDRISEGNWLS